MAAKLPSLLLFLFLFTLEEMVMKPAEAELCSARSKVFRGLCFSRSNCAAICENEGFLFGECEMFKCICRKDCNLGGTPSQGPPDQGPPDGPPDQGPPESPPDQGPPESPPDQGPPEEGPSDQNPPDEDSIAPNAGGPTVQEPHKGRKGPANPKPPTGGEGDELFDQGPNWGWPL